MITPSEFLKYLLIFGVFPGGGGGSTIVEATDDTIAVTQPVSGTYSIAGNYQAGTNVTITGNVISASPGTQVIEATNDTILVTNPSLGTYSIAANYTAGANISITGNVIAAVLPSFSLSAANTTAVVNNPSPGVYTIAGGYGAGANITITGNIISSTNPVIVESGNSTIAVSQPTTGTYSITGAYVAGSNINITGNVISAIGTTTTVNSANSSIIVTNPIPGTYSISGAYVGGANVTVVGNVISAVGGGSIVVEAANDTAIVTNPSLGVYAVAGNYQAGDGIRIIGNTVSAITSNDTGISTLVGGTVVVPYPSITINNFVNGSVQTPSGTQGFLSFPVTPGVGFTINSTSSTEASTVGWEILTTNTIPLDFGLISLSGGNATVISPYVTATSRIILSIRNPVYSNGKILQVDRTPGTSFTISSGYGLDESLISWAIFDTDSAIANGFATLIGGSISVSFPELGADDIVLVTINDGGSDTTGSISVENKVASTGFGITSNYENDGSVIAWAVIPAASALPHGVFSLVSGGFAAVADANVLDSSVILISGQIPGSNITFGNYTVIDTDPGINFEVQSTSEIDTAQLGYVILNN